MDRPFSVAAAFLILALGCNDNLAPEDAGAGPISGTITSHKTGQGLGGIAVALLDDGGLRATSHTDAAGRFEFARVGNGDYAVQPIGLELAGLDARIHAIEPVQHTVTVGAERSELVFTVLTLIAPRVTGEITCGGLPVEGARVRVAGGQSDVSVATNAQGKFGALDLGPGVYVVIAEDASCEFAPSFQIIELRSGQSATVNFSGAGL